jgi:hypothetical protein
MKDSDINKDVVRITDDRIRIKSTNDIFIEDDITYNKIQNKIIKKENNFHYLTYNSSINAAKNNYQSINNFDLIRTKFNLMLTNVFVKEEGKKDSDENYEEKDINIPGEFIDISIPCFEDTFGRHYNYDAERCKFEFDLDLRGHIFKYECYTLSYIVYDIQGILYDQNPFTPWSDSKYKKRIKRLLFIYLMGGGLNYFTNNPREIITFLDKISYMICLMEKYIYLSTLSETKTLPSSKVKDSEGNMNDILKKLMDRFFCSNINQDRENKYKSTYNQVVENFINIKSRLYLSHTSIKNFNFGDFDLYNKGLDIFINTTIYVFLEYITFNHISDKLNSTKNTLLKDINNYIRQDCNLEPFNNVTQYYELFIKKIPDYLIDLSDVLNTLKIVQNLLNSGPKPSVSRASSGLNTSRASSGLNTSRASSGETVSRVSSG